MILEQLGILVILLTPTGSSSGLSYISLIRSKLILASCDSFIDSMEYSTAQEHIVWQSSFQESFPLLLQMLLPDMR